MAILGKQCIAFSPIFCKWNLVFLIDGGATCVCSVLPGDFSLASEPSVVLKPLPYLHVAFRVIISRFLWYQLISVYLLHRKVNILSFYLFFVFCYLPCKVDNIDNILFLVMFWKVFIAFKSQGLFMKANILLELYFILNFFVNLAIIIWLICPRKNSD